MQPLLVNPNLIGQMEGYTHQASFIYFAVNIDMKLVADELYNFMSAEKDLNFGVSTPVQNVLIIRILGYKAEQLFDCLKAIAKRISSLKSELHAT